MIRTRSLPTPSIMIWSVMGLNRLMAAIASKTEIIVSIEDLRTASSDNRPTSVDGTFEQANAFKLRLPSLNRRWSGEAS